MDNNSKKNAQKVFHGVRFDVNALELTTRSGKTARREYVAHPGAVVILPLLDSNRVVMIKNYRFAVDEVLWELPAGTLELNEQPALAAGRELIEETGYTASTIEPLMVFYTSPGICNEVMYSYVAKDLTLVGQNLDDGEDIEVVVLTWDQVSQLITNGEIKDAKTLCTLLFYLNRKGAS